MKPFWTTIAVLTLMLIAFVDGMLVQRQLSKFKTTEAQDLNWEELLPEEPETEITQIDAVEEAQTLTVPFIMQSPLWDWKSPWTDYAEEATLLMAYNAIYQIELTAQEQARALLAMGSWEAEHFGDSLQTNMEQNLYLLSAYFGHQNSQLVKNPSAQQLTQYLEAGALIAAPVNGQILGNPYYSKPGPQHHNILIIGTEGQNFIAHDPGTSRGEATSYSQTKILEALQDLDGSKTVLVIQST